MADPPLIPRRCPSRSLAFIRGATFWVSAIILLIALALQGILLVRGSWELPDFVVQRLHEELEESGWSAGYSSLGFRPPGTVLVKDLQLTRLHDDHPFATATIARLEFDLRELLHGQVNLLTVYLQEGTVYCPPHLSPTGVPEPIVRDTHVTARRLPKAWDIDSINGRIHSLTFCLEGVLPDFRPRADGPADVHAMLNTILPRLVRDKELFLQAENPHLDILLAPRDERPWRASFHAFADSFATRGGIEVMRPRLKGGFSYDGTTWEASEVWTEAAAASARPYEARLTGIRGNLLWDRAEEGFHPLAPTAAVLTVSTLQTSLVNLNEVQLRARSTSRTAGTVDLFSLFADGGVSGKASGDWDRGDARAEVLVRATPNSILQNPMVEKLGLRHDVFFHRPPLLRATAEAKDWKLVQAEGRAQSGPVEIDGIFFDRAWASANFDGRRFVVPKMILGFRDFEATGAYDVNLETLDYRLLFQGSLRPLHISPWFQPWWTDLWSEITFADSPLRGDVDIQGTLSQPETVHVVGSVQAKDFHLRGVPFRDLEGQLFILADYVDFHRVRLRREEGEASGEFQYFSDRSKGELGRLRFQAESTLDPVALTPIFGTNGARLLSPFRFQSPPALRLHGTIGGPAVPELTRVEFSARTENGLAYAAIPLDRLHIEAVVTADDWQLNKLNAGIAGGSALGHVRKWTEDETEKLSFTMQMEKLDIKTASAILEEWQARADGAARAHLPTAAPGGILDLQMEATGDYGDFQSFVGEGNLRVRQADLAEVHLLGLLSRLLSVTPLAFTSLHFTDADSRFTVDNNIIHFPNLRLSGPGSALRAMGDYRIDQEELDFAVKLFLLKKSRVPLVSTLLSPLLEPLAHITEIRLIGPVSNPQWRFLLGPTNILSGIAAPAEAGEPDEL